MNDILNQNIIIADLETTGTDCFFDQILSSAKIKIENDNIKDVFYENCRCEDSHLPNPEALLVNAITQDHLNNAMPLNDLLKLDYNFTQKYPNHFIVCHNSSFDFNFIFCSLFQNLTTSDWYCWKTNNRLMCTYQMLRSLFVFKKNTYNYIKLPMHECSDPNFRLEALTHANDIPHDSHNSFGDVHATYEIYKLIRHENPGTVRQAMRCADKKFVKNLIQDNAFFCTDVGFGQDLYPRILAPICYVSNQNQILCLDIAQADPNELNPLSSWDVYIQTSKQKVDNVFVKIPVNKCKIFYGQDYYQKSYNPLNLNFNQLKNRADSIKKNPYLVEICEGSHEFFSNQYDNQNAENYLEKTIFDNFALPNEKNFITKFNSIPWAHRWEFVNDSQYIDSNSRLSRLAKRSICQYDSQLVPEEAQAMFKQFLKNRFSGSDNSNLKPWNNFMRALKNIEELKKKYPMNIVQIKEIENYIDQRMLELY